MTRLIHRSFLLLALVPALGAALGCGETTNPEITQLTFDRPVDIAFACHGNLRITNGGTADPSQPIEASAMPAFACETRSQKEVEKPAQCQTSGAQDRATEPPTAPGQETLYDAGCKVLSQASPVSWYGLILQSGPGTVAIAQFTPKQVTSGPQSSGDDAAVLDAAALVPGKNSISVGEEPVAIHTDAAGCHAITANAGSCDLSILDLNSALDLKNPDVRVDRLEVKSASGAPVRARPAAMVGEPSEELVGSLCPAQPRGLVYVAYPSCHLVAAVDTTTGTIVSSIQYDAAGAPTIVVGGDVSCPAECGGGGAVTAGVRPVALDLEVDLRSVTSPRRLVIGADNSASITIVNLDQDWLPIGVSTVTLEDSTSRLGITAVALSPEIGMGGDGPMLDDDGAGVQFQFVYAVATDGTVRVADVLNQNRECDTQVDPRFARETRSVAELSCLQGGMPLTPRRAGARSPGIHLPGEAIPLSVEIFRSDEPVGGSRSDKVPGTLLGYFALITASNGSSFIVNIDDDNYPDVFNLNAPLAVPVPLAMAHQLRDALGGRNLLIDDEDQAFNPDPDTAAGETDRSEDDKDCTYNGRVTQLGEALGGPRAALPPTRTVPAGSIATEKLTQLPGFRQVLCDRRVHHGAKQTAEDLRAIPELVFAAPADARDRSFPDLMALPDAETWSLVWEGSLSQNTGDTDVGGPAVRESMLRVDGLGLHVLDDGNPFCAAGVERFDILQLRGCDPASGAADCPSGYTCFVHPDSQIQGLGACMLDDEADRLANACRDYLTTVRRYTIETTKRGELIALPRRHELRTTPVDGCVSDQQCQSLANYAARSASGRHPFEDTTAPDPHTWACVIDPLRAPIGGTGKRCELRCDVTEDCLGGTVCQGAVPGQPKSGFCMEGVIPPQACINASQRYELRAGEAFAVVGSRSGFVHPIVADTNGQCVRDPAANRLSIGRLPLLPKDRMAPDTVHMCEAIDLITGERMDGTFDPNPCFITIPHTASLPIYGEACSLVSQDGQLVELQVPAVRFRNRGLTFTIVDPYYPGDQMCITDRLANLGRIPHVVPGTALSFRQTAGFIPMRAFVALSADNQPSFPVKIVRGPTQSLWVLDEGDFLSSSATQASTRGKVLRFHPVSPGASNVLK